VFIYGLPKSNALVLCHPPAGDFAILLSSGMRWYVALTYNFLSAITAIVGMFIGVAIGSSEEDATLWILAITAGIFLYVALVDLVIMF